MFIVIALLLFSVSLLFRTYGFFNNYPFWVDEFSSAVQSNFFIKYGLSVFTNPDVYIEHHNIPLHILTAWLFQIFGQSEWVARLPSVFFGSIIPVLVFIIGRSFFDQKTAFSASLLTVFSYLQITWSRQARSYVLLQFLILLSVYFYFKFFTIKSGNKTAILILFLLTILIGFITHSFFYIFIIALIVHFLLTRIADLLLLLRTWQFYAVTILFFFVANKIGLYSTFLIYFNNGGFVANNIWYYHSLLWREYGLITFLSILGLITAIINKNKYISLLGIYIILHLLFISLIFKPYTSRYILPIFPFIIIFVGYFLSQFADFLLKKKGGVLTNIISLGLAIFIILNGHKFVNNPKNYYSVNHDFRDIALLDYHQVYNLIKTKGDLAKGKTAVIETWPARTYWYLGINYRPTYIFKWKGQIPFNLNKKNEKIVPRNNGILLIEDLTDLKKAIRNYPKGFIFIDDSSLPEDVINYAEKKLKKELYLDHYTLDDNPYSIWPATLYSWGL